MSATHYLAVDLGAESGRIMLGTLENGRVALEEIHRFPNITLKEGKHLHWDLANLDREIFAGLDKAAARNVPIAGISTDSWGVDYVLLDAKGNVLGQPYCYRDERSKGGSERFLKVMPFTEVYAETGIQFMGINTIYHFEAQQHADKTVFANADHFLHIADYFNARFSGVEAVEESMASTTQMYNPKTRNWSDKIIAALGIKKSLFPKIVEPATVLGPVTGALKAKPSLANAKVIATCSHDTGAAVAAVPGRGEKWAYLSSGTWSLLGAELPGPVLTEAASAASFTNEVGLRNTIRFLKNIAGLWVLQECRRAWEAAGQKFDYDQLTKLAIESGPAKAHLCLEDERFLGAGQMPEKIVAYCRETGQPEPKTPGEFTRTILESLALTYDKMLGLLEKLVGRKFDTLHIVGGGSKSNLLNQLAADAIQRTVITGPVEATAIGNILIQALALGHVESAGHLRQIVENSFPTQTFLPGSGFTDAVRARFQKLQPTKS
jgi:rhamnulokinase